MARAARERSEQGRATPLLDTRGSHPFARSLNVSAGCPSAPSCRPMLLASPGRWGETR